MYILRVKKRKIFMLSDHQLATSGVGVQSRYLISGLINTGKYSFICFGGAIKHENLEQVNVNDDFIIKPTEGFGTKEQIKLVLAQERPDAMLLFTDPRFFTHIFEMEDEIHQVCPIAFNHIWDNFPAPDFNKVVYESVDLVNCINQVSYTFCKEWFPEKTNFVPHAVPKELFRPLPDDKREAARARYISGRPKDAFVAAWVSRNARRKMPSDVLASWKIFLDTIQTRTGRRDGVLVMHTDPFDMEGPNLHHVVRLLGLDGNVIFSKERGEFEYMNELYNAADVTLSRSCAEGFGLSMLESMMAGTPIIALKTGGMTHQVIDHRDGSENGIGLDPEVKSLVGSQGVPFIYEDHISHQTFADAIIRMYDMGPQERRRLGQKACAYANYEFTMERLISSWDASLTKMIDEWQTKKSRQWSLTRI